jgi:hypothetical protein
VGRGLSSKCATLPRALLIAIAVVLIAMVVVAELLMSASVAARRC